MKALILSAGMGERLRPVTLKRAKPAVEFLNVPMLGIPGYWLSRLGLTDITFNTHYLPQTIRTAARRCVSPNLHIHFSHEPQILGSGGGIWNSRFTLTGEHFAVANADGVVLSSNLNWPSEMLDFHLRQQALCTILVCSLDGAGEKIPGVWVDSANRVNGFGLQPPSSGLTAKHYASYMLFSQRIWNGFPDSSSNILYDVLINRIANGEGVFAFEVSDLKWFETGHGEDFLLATEFCVDQIHDCGPYSSFLNTYLDLHHPDRELKSYDRFIIAESADIGPDVQLGGFVTVARDARIGRGAKLKDCVVLSDAQVAPNSEFERSILF